MRTWLAVLSLAVLSLGLGSMLGSLAWPGCGSQASDVASPAPSPPTPVRVERVVARPFAPRWVAPGLVEPEARISLAFRVGGEIARFEVEEGDRVETGDVLAELDRTDLTRAVQAARAALARARARAEEAELVFARQRRLVELASTSQQRFDTARSSREIAAAELWRARLELEAAEQRLARGILRAPRAGYIERRLADPHEHAAAGAAVVVLTALDPVTVRSAVPDTAVSLLREGAPAWVRSGAWPGRRFEGRLERIALTADEDSRTLPFEVRLANPELALKPEMAVEVELRAGAERPLPAVPLVAVLRGLDAVPFGFVVVGEGALGRVERRILELGPIDGERVRVRAGLAPGERLVVRGQHFVRAGDGVRVVEEGP